jgi:diguanylate cyclase (GGDEF)-like protein/PAS domain S-box-containing protein
MGREENRAGTSGGVTDGRALRDLQTSERLYRSLFENMIDGYAQCRMLYDKEGRPEDFICLEVNPAFERLTGLTDVVGKRASEVIPGIQQTNPELLEMFGRAALSGEHSRFETHVEALGIWLSIAVYSPRKDHFAAVFENITERRRIQDRLRLTQLSVDRAADLILWMAPNGRLLYASDSNCRRHGYSREEMLGMTIFDLDPTLSPEAWPERWRELKESGSITFDTTHKTKGGELFPVELTTNFVEQDGKEYNFSYGRDISRRKQVEDALRLTQLSVDHAADLIHWVAPDGQLLYVSGSNCERHGYSREEMLDMSIFDLDPTMPPEAWPKHWRELKESGSITFETMHKTKGGELFPLEITANYVEQDGREYNFAFARDITERKRVQEELHRANEAAERANAELLEAQRILELQVRTDALTGTLNRRAVLERLGEEMARAERSGTSLAVAMIDIDHFKDVNDTYGHGAGDQVLREVVARASRALRPYDGFGRFGGEEFLAVLPHSSGRQVIRALERVRLAICSAPIKVHGYEVSVAISIGADLDCGGGPDDVIRSADAALYRAKADGRNRVVVSASTSAPDDEHVCKTGRGGLIITAGTGLRDRRSC